MSNRTLSRINFTEAEYYYKSPHTLLDCSYMQSFGLIKSTVDVFVYYGINDFTAEDIQAFFERLQFFKKDADKAFIPSPKKISGVLECYLKDGKESLSLQDGHFYVNAWAGNGYGFEITAARQSGKLS